MQQSRWKSTEHEMPVLGKGHVCVSLLDLGKHFNEAIYSTVEEETRMCNVTKNMLIQITLVFANFTAWVSRIKDVSRMTVRT